jgi:hypothetical protein
VPKPDLSAALKPKESGPRWQTSLTLTRATKRVRRRTSARELSGEPQTPACCPNGERRCHARTSSTSSNAATGTPNELATPSKLRRRDVSELDDELTSKPWSVQPVACSRDLALGVRVGDVARFIGLIRRDTAFGLVASWTDLDGTAGVVLREQGLASVGGSLFVLTQELEPCKDLEEDYRSSDAPSR